MTDKDFKDMQAKHTAMVQEIFPAAGDIYCSDTKNVSFEMTHEDVTFDDLERLSISFKTKNINFRIGSIVPGCESCGHGGSTTVEIKGGSIGSRP